MRVTVLSKAAALALAIPYNSPTSITGWLECPRKWGFRYIARLPSPQHASAALGSDAHTQLELYETKGTPLDFTRPSGEILQSGLHFFPAPGTTGLEGEGEFYLRSKRTGFLYMGKKDIGLPPGVPQPQLGFDGSAPIVLDLKTTSSIEDYSKSEEDLRFDPQAALYGLEAMVRFGTDVADLGWIYCQTKKTKKSKPVTFRVHLPVVEHVFDAIEGVVSEMHDARERAKASGQTPADFIQTLPPNLKACKAYGGCPHAGRECHLTPSQKARANMSGNNLIASLRNRVQGTPAPAITETPPTMGVSDRDVPPAPENEIPVPFREPDVTVKKDPINPPESSLPPAPLPEKASAEDDKPKKERKARVKREEAPKSEPAEQRSIPGTEVAESNGAAVAAHTGRTYPLGTQGVPAERVGAPSAPIPDFGFTLYVDCIPDGIRPVYADALVSHANDIIAQRQKTTDEPVEHYKFMSYGKGAGALALVLEEVLEGYTALDHVFASSGSEALAILTCRAARIVRSVR